MAKSWIENTSFGEGIKSLSYDQLIEMYGEDRGKEVAKHFGIKKERKKKVQKKEEEGGE